jgi:hypothetical protein
MRARKQSKLLERNKINLQGETRSDICRRQWIFKIAEILYYDSSIRDFVFHGISNVRQAYINLTN